MERHTYEYGLIGNCAFLAHIGKDTNVAWMCWPRFDSSFVFGNLLDKDKGGEFTILPPQPQYQSHQYYIQNTNILCTEIETESGKYRITDFAPRFYQNDRYFRPLMLIRKIEPLSGNPRVRLVCRPKGNYGQLSLRPHRGSNHIQYVGLEQAVRLTTNISLTYIENEQAFVLNETKYLVLTYAAPLEAPLESTCERFLASTRHYWQRWVKSTSISDFYQEYVIRSSLVLKIHQYEDTGAIIAAASTSLPESPNSGRNWDYRFCWMRDTYYTLNAFNNIGHFEELERYFHYIVNITLAEAERGRPRIQPLYSISGESQIVEQVLELDGYAGGPVRIGNQAYEHIQNDVYGQILVSLLPLYADSRLIDHEHSNSEKLIFMLLQKIADTMQEPDAGLWEFRDLAQYHCYTFLFHWAGSHAAIRIAKIRKDAKMLEWATQLAGQAQEKIEQCLDTQRGVYTQAIGSPHLDASTLQLILMGYLDPASPLAARHLQNLEQELGTSEGLFYRYRHTDDFGEPETTFLICGFWHVETLACMGRLDEAIINFQKLLQYVNHVGLLSEDVDYRTGSQWGNFPQAYSHVGLMNAAARISKKLDKPNFMSFAKH
ncbi:MAG: glycoside hydrolase family 15 protein [Microscillaceae bacterium]|nr:glycoside hydrolase family 15 protein [Microscillaceae bacterium]